MERKDYMPFLWNLKMNKAERLFERIGFWNMPSVRISERNQLEKLGVIKIEEDNCKCGEHHGTNNDCSFCK